MSIYKFQKTCRLCSNNDFRLILDLGLQPPSNSFLSKNQLKIRERKFPLRLYLCKKCHHLQLLDVVDKEYLFSKYLYLTSANKPIIKHFNKYANLMYEKFLKKKNKPLPLAWPRAGLGSARPVPPTSPHPTILTPITGR